MEILLEIKQMHVTLTEANHYRLETLPCKDQRTFLHNQVVTQW